MPFDKIIPAVLAGEFDAGLIIHEGQLTYSRDGLMKILDLGVWWFEQTGLPLPLGGNAIRRSLGGDVQLITTNALRDSIQHALDHREAALEYAMQFARDLDTNLANRFVGMYVNERTINYGDDGREAIRKLLDMGYERGIIPQKAARRLRWLDLQPGIRGRRAGTIHRDILLLCAQAVPAHFPRELHCSSLRSPRADSGLDA